MDDRKGVDPFVSIIIPVLNCNQDVEGCVSALREQNYPESMMEIIFVDNGSTDGTIQELERCNVSFMRRKERGRSLALNVGLENAKGELICTTDVSCRPNPDWIQNIVNCFKDPSVGCVAGEIELICPSEPLNLALRYQKRNNYMSPMISANRRQAPFFPFADGANASFRRHLFEKIGGFDELFFKAADVEICYRMFVLTEYKIAFCKQCSVSETGEPSLLALLKQRFRIGMGVNLMRAKYPEFYQIKSTDSALKQSYWRVLNSFQQIFKFGSSLFEKDITNVENILVSKLMAVSQVLGSWYGRWRLINKKVQPERISAECLINFLNQKTPIDERIVFH